MTPPGTEVSTNALHDALRSWCEALEALRITLTEDRPKPGLSALGDGLADATDEVTGWLLEADACRALPDSPRETPRLIARALRTQGEKLFGSVHHAQLERLARTGGAAWHAWVTAVRCALDPLWARAEDTVRHLGALSPPPEPTTHTTSHTTHIRTSDTFNPST